MTALCFGYIWLVATIYMNGTREPFPAFVVALFGGVIVTMIASLRRSSRCEELERRYSLLYGAVPPTGDLKGTRYGAAAGGATGNYVAGAVIGAVIDLFREGKQREQSTSEQIHLLDELRTVRAGGSVAGLLTFGFALMVSAVFAYI